MISAAKWRCAARMTRLQVRLWRKDLKSYIYTVEDIGLTTSVTVRNGPHTMKPKVIS